MTTETPLTCYICGELNDDVYTVDQVGLLADSESATERFEEKFGRKPEGYLHICAECEEKHPHHARNTYKKYGFYAYSHDIRTSGGYAKLIVAHDIDEFRRTPGPGTTEEPDKPYACDFDRCDYRGFSKESLKQHMRDKHGIDENVLTDLRLSGDIDE